MNIDFSQYIINFHGLIKNRRGPYKIVLRTTNGRYLTIKNGYREYLSSKEDAHDYSVVLSSKSPCYAFNAQKRFRDEDNIALYVYLTTSGGDLSLFKKNFKPGALYI